MMNLENTVMISVIMPVYNSEKYLENAIRSVLSQTYSNFELVLVDDGSTDNCMALCDKYSDLDSRVKTLHKKNGGVCSARNIGIKVANGKYICFIDNDDVYDIHFLERMIEVINDCPCDIIKCGRKNILITPELKEVKSREFGFSKNKHYSFFDFMKSYYIVKMTGCFNSVWNGMYRANFLKANNLIFDEKFMHGNEDLLFNYCMLECEPTIYLIKDI